jgi:hypothetical protein
MLPPRVDGCAAVADIFLLIFFFESQRSEEMRRHQRDPIAEHEELLLEAINTGKTEYLLLYAQYFAGAKDPQQVKMTDLDAMGTYAVVSLDSQDLECFHCGKRYTNAIYGLLKQGFTLTYVESDLEETGEDAEATKKVSVQKEIRIQFDSPVQHLNHIEPKLFALAKEAVQALDKSVCLVLYKSLVKISVKSSRGDGSLWTDLIQRLEPRSNPIFILCLSLSSFSHAYCGVFCCTLVSLLQPFLFYKERPSYRSIWPKMFSLS